jgi:hypothetical protein
MAEVEEVAAYLITSFEVLMVLKVQVRFFWVVIPCSVHPEDGGSKTF